jgi:hypothetical protein
MVEGGLIDFYIRHSNTSKIPVIVETHKDVSLSMEHLGVWFVISSTLLGFAFFCFSMEILIVREFVIDKLQKVSNNVESEQFL